MKKISLMIIFVLALGSMAHAQTLVPATSEDLGDFDRQLQEAQSEKRPEARQKPLEPGKPSREEKEKNKSKSNFGSLVSQEAKKMKDLENSQPKGMGQWVREQRQQSELKNPTASQGQGAAGSNVNPARENSSNAPGQSGKKKK